MQSPWRNLLLTGSVGALVAAVSFGLLYWERDRAAARTTFEGNVLPLYEQGRAFLEDGRGDVEAVAAFTEASRQLKAILPAIGVSRQMQDTQAALVSGEIFARKRVMLNRYVDAVRAAQVTEKDALEKDVLRSLVTESRALLAMASVLPADVSWHDRLTAASLVQWFIIFSIQEGVVDIGELKGAHESGIQFASDAVDQTRRSGDFEGYRMAVQMLEFLTRGNSPEDLLKAATSGQPAVPDIGKPVGGQEQQGAPTQGARAGEAGLGWVPLLDPAQLPQLGFPLPFGLPGSGVGANPLQKKK